MSDSQSIVTERATIRLMFGIGNNMVMGFSIIYERPNGTVDRTWVWYSNDDLFNKIVFIDEGPSEIVWEITQTVSKAGFFNPKEEIHKHRRLKEIRIRRDFQFKP